MTPRISAVLDTAGDLIGGVSLFALFVGGSFMGCIFDAITSEAEAAEIGKIATDHGYLDWLAGTGYVVCCAYVGTIIGNYIARAILGYLERLSERQRVELEEANAAFDAMSESLLCDVLAERQDDERFSRHREITVGMTVSGMDRDILAGLFPAAFPYPEF